MQPNNWRGEGHSNDSPPLTILDPQETDNGWAAPYSHFARFGKGKPLTAGIAHLATAGAYFIMGSVLLCMALRMWFTEPLNRVFRLGPYITEDGLRLVLSLWPFVFLFGAFILSCAVDHALDFMVHKGWVDQGILNFSAVVEAVISVWTAGCVVMAATGLSWKKK